MNASSLPQLAPPGSLRAQALKWWTRLEANERRGLTLALLAVGILLILTVAVQPAARTLRVAPPKLDQLEAELQQMRQWAAETRRLQKIPPVTRGQATAAIKAATGRMGESASILLQGNRAVLKLDGTDGVALGSWLAEARSAARAQTTEASLVRGANGYAGTLVVRLGEDE